MSLRYLVNGGPRNIAVLPSAWIEFLKSFLFRLRGRWSTPAFPARSISNSRIRNRPFKILFQGVFYWVIASRRWRNGALSKQHRRMVLVDDVGRDLSSRSHYPCNLSLLVEALQGVVNDSQCIGIPAEIEAPIPKVCFYFRRGKGSLRFKKNLTDRIANAHISSAGSRKPLDASQHPIGIRESVIERGIFFQQRGQGIYGFLELIEAIVQYRPLPKDFLNLGLGCFKGCSVISGSHDNSIYTER